MMRRRVIATLLTAFLALPLSACATDDTVEEQKPAPQEQQAPAEGGGGDGGLGY